MNRHHDEGFTLIELIIAIVLSGLIAGVIVAALLTSLNIADSVQAQLHDSTDASLVSAFLYRDAQAAGGTDPATAEVDPSVGVSTDDWGECAQDGELVFRFSWYDRKEVTTKRLVTATYALDGDQLIRRICEDGTEPSEVELGRFIDPDSVSASCVPVDCSAQIPDYVTLAMSGSGTRAPFSFTLTASLRPQTQETPTTGNSPTVPLVALGGDTATCPNLELGGSSTLTVLGDVTVATECSGGGDAMQGDQTLSVDGLVAELPGLTDALADLDPPPGVCIDNPAVDGDWAPGVYVFCDGLTIGPNAVVTGTDILFYLLAGDLTVDPAARVDLAAASSGQYANVLAWVPGGDVTIGVGTAANTYGGLIYAPASTVAVEGPPADAEGPVDDYGAVNIGGIVARTVNFGGGGISTRLGLPIPTITISPTTLRSGQVGLSYQHDPTPAAGGGTSEYAWTSTPLPDGLSFDASTGIISGTPTTAGEYTVTVTVLDSTDAAASLTYALTINPPLEITCTETLSETELGDNYSAQPATASGGALPYTWSATGLPDGLSITSGSNPSLMISGKTEEWGGFDVHFTVTDNDGASQGCTLPLTVTLPAELAVGDNIQTEPNPDGEYGRLDAGDKLIYSYEGAVNPYLIFAGWDGRDPVQVFVRFAAGNMFSKNSRPTDKDFIDVFTTDPMCTSKPSTPTLGDVQVGAISMGTRDKNYGGGVVVVVLGQITATTDQIIIEITGPHCRNDKEWKAAPTAGNMTWYPPDGAAPIIEVDPPGTPVTPDIDF